MADYDISKAFEVIEDELIKSMIRNLDRHRAEETAQGFNWSQWQVEQLRALEEYRRKNSKIFPSRFNKLNSQITQLLNDSYHNGGVKQERRILQEIKRGFKGKGTNEPPYTGKTEMTGEFFGVNDRKLQSLIEATTHDMQKAETAVLRLADDQYRKAIFNAQVYANAGAGTYEKAVDMATRDMLRAGLNCIQYRNGARHTLSDYADMAVRTAVKRAYLQGEGKKRQEWGITTVILNRRSSPCPECLPFVGRVFIDDVWSGGDTSGISPITGIKYPLLSEAIAQGLYHPRCKDSHTTYFEGINSTPEDSEYTKEELKALAEEYELLAEQEKQGQKVNQAKNQAEKCERISQYSLDEENKKIYKARAEQWREKEKVYADTLNAIATENQKVFNSSNNPVAENSTPNAVANSNGSGIIEPIRYYAGIGDKLAKFKSKIKNAVISDEYKPVSTEYLSSLPKIKNDETMEQALKATNPKGYTDNCQRCVPTYEMRRRGYNVIALASPENPFDDNIGLYDYKKVFVGANWITCKDTGKKEIIEFLKKSGNGTRVEIAIRTKDTAHVFVAEKTTDGIKFIDPQRNLKNIERYFDKVITGTTEFCRIDNLEFSNLIKDCIEVN